MVFEQYRIVCMVARRGPVEFDIGFVGPGSRFCCCRAFSPSAPSQAVVSMVVSVSGDTFFLERRSLIERIRVVVVSIVCGMAGYVVVEGGWNIWGPSHLGFEFGELPTIAVTWRKL
jgi:hypothetical protein